MYGYVARTANITLMFVCPKATAATCSAWN
jgi:hypothetical protein